MVNVDKDRIIQALRGLLSNALQHTPRGGRVSVSAEYVSKASRSQHNGLQSNNTLQCIQINISDTGVGISPVS